MSQTQKAAAYLIFGYIVFTTLRGNLRAWLQILGVKK